MILKIVVQSKPMPEAAEVSKALSSALLQYVLAAKNHIVAWKLAGHPVRRRTGTLARSIQERKRSALEYELGSYGVEYAAKLNYAPEYWKYNYWLERGAAEALEGTDRIAEKAEEAIVKTLLGGAK